MQNVTVPTVFIILTETDDHIYAFLNVTIQRTRQQSLHDAYYTLTYSNLTIQASYMAAVCPSCSYGIKIILKTTSEDS